MAKQGQEQWSAQAQGQEPEQGRRGRPRPERHALRQGVPPADGTQKQDSIQIDMGVQIGHGQGGGHGGPEPQARPLAGFESA